jgi:hypothetical protein
MYNKGDVLKLNPASGLAAQWSSWRAVVLSYNPHDNSVCVLVTEPAKNVPYKKSIYVEQLNKSCVRADK